MRKVNKSSIFELKMIENEEYRESLLDSGYPIKMLEKELNRNLTILNTTIVKIESDYILIEVIFLHPD